MDYYTGPYWSDGRFQSSIAFGSNIPIDNVDNESRLHDTAYAVYPDQRHRVAADWLYSQRLEQDTSYKARIIRNIPYYANLASASHVSALFTPFIGFGLLDYILHVYYTQNEIKNNAYNKEISDVLNLYKEDPMGNYLAPVVYPESYDPKPAQNTWLRGAAVAPSNEWVVGPNGGSAPKSGPTADLIPDPKQVRQTMVNSEDGSMLYPHVYMPYKPLKKKRRRITLRMVELYNREHGTNHTLKEVQDKVGLYF